MNIIVCIKQVPDTEARVQISEQGNSIDSGQINFILNPFDEYAVEEALRTQEKLGGEVTVVTLGDESAENAIRTAMAMGADKGILLKADRATDDPLQVARALAAEIASGEFDIVFFGKQGVGNEHGQVGMALAELIGVPGISGVSRLEVSAGAVKGAREVEGGMELFECGLPAVISTQKGLNEPRYPSLKGRMAAKKKPLEVKPVALAAPLLTVEALAYPPQRERGRVLGEGSATVAELVRCLKEEAKVI
ncbi:electron transfer flavoprotein subunit beta/FixA family protein [bacterium]|nr:electron transfer flavoprotein subunit beta/FixA family protein [bacterium]